MIIDYLKEEFAQRNQKNLQYSLRAFARSLNMHSSTLSAILNGKRKITAKSAFKILEQLEIDPIRKKRIVLSLVEERPGTEKLDYHQLDEATLSLISGWEHYALLSALELPSTSKDEESLAQRLGLRPDEARQALQRLEAAGLVRRDGFQWALTGKNLTTTHDIPSSSLRKIHRSYIEKALDSLDNQSVESRDITGMTLIAPKAKMGLVKKLIADFRRELSEILETDSADEVYRLNIQFFPLTK